MAFQKLKIGLDLPLLFKLKVPIHLTEFASADGINLKWH